MTYTPRELSWMDFNDRVLAEAQREDNLPLDRLKFLAITASNLDEFFMVRVSFLHDSRNQPDVTEGFGMSPSDQLAKVLDRAKAFQEAQNDCLLDILNTLHDSGIRIARIDELTEIQSDFVAEMFWEEVMPVITPLAVDPSRPFPFLANKSLNIGVRLKDGNGENVYAVVQVPSILVRLIRLPGKDDVFLPMEDLIIHHLPEIFNTHEIIAYGQFRITRSADLDADDDTDNLKEEMKRTLKMRRRGMPIRLELGTEFDKALRNFIHKMLGVNKRYVIELPGILDMAALSKIAGLPGHPTRSIPPVIAPDFAGVEDIFEAIRERDRFVHHPYHDFAHVTRFIETAAEDPDVLAIKQTLYRVSGRGKIISALEQAAENGKQVTVLVELKARFDEENNIQWATRLERAGCHVIYGLAGLKTHCKMTLVIRRELSGIRRYVHLSTGNYNDVSAKIYADVGVFTCRAAIGEDASLLFNRLTGFSEPLAYNKFVTAPENALNFILHRIDEEMKNAANGLPCGIDIKVNSLLDLNIMQKLIQAGESGVPIRLLVRGICALRPVNKNINIRSIVGHFLEHTRAFVFENGGDKLVYLGSMDLMPRNLYRRVELIFPVEDDAIKEQIYEMLELQWLDNTNAWDQGADGVYRRAALDSPRLTAQHELARRASDALKTVQQDLQDI